MLTLRPTSAARSHQLPPSVNRRQNKREWWTTPVPGVVGGSPAFFEQGQGQDVMRMSGGVHAVKWPGGCRACMMRSALSLCVLICNPDKCFRVVSFGFTIPPRTNQCSSLHSICHFATITILTVSSFSLFVTPGIESIQEEPWDRSDIQSCNALPQLPCLLSSC